MVVREGDGFSPSIELNSSQLQAREEIFSALEESRGGQKFVILRGLSGVGKSTLLESLKTDSKAKGCLVTSPLLLTFDSERAKVKRHRGLVIADCNIYETQSLKRDEPSFDWKTVTLKGMTMSETRSMLIKLLGGQTTKVPVDVLTDLSLGIPQLVRELAVAPELSRQQVNRLTAHHLIEVSRGDWKDLLFIKPAKEALALLPKISMMRPESIYDFLDSVLAKKVAGPDFRQLVSPLFVAPESEEIYAKMLKAGTDRRNSLMIFAPNIPLEQMQGVKSELKNFQYEGIDGSPRFRMFGIDARKTNLWMKDLDGTEFVRRGESENVFLGRTLVEWQQQYVSQQFPIKFEGQRGGQLFLSAHEHSGLVVGPARKGWIIESMLQQLNVPYYVENTTIGDKYLFSPHTQRIEHLK
jgi:ABC-type cobalamin/Fe3+-siderophores transport system ATPase subunit